jgi:hypothetical protein
MLISPSYSTVCHIRLSVVKSSVIEAVARCTQAEIVESIDKLTLSQDIKLGRCALYRVETYICPKIPGYRKSHLVFDGCQSSLGCTLVLRGEDMEILKKLKHIVDLMVFTAYSLVLESCLFRDQYTLAPPVVAVVGSTGDSLLHPYTRSILSTSPCVKFPPPFLLTRAIDEQKRLALKKKVPNDVASVSSEGRSLAHNIDEFSLETRAGLRYLLENEEMISPFGHQVSKDSNVGRIYVCCIALC